MSRHEAWTQRHRELIANVNNARTEAEHREADAYLQGWRAGLNPAGDGDSCDWMNQLDWIDADLHHEGDDAKRPMCLGVFLDWRPPADLRS